ncbi:hypothetical protein [Halobacterium sp. R2-5]|uniref:hypothetical protein n=1 Tax=Halobacterium sp. R2-5 TaxID=2715751 RepID=UPI001AAE7F4A|nr:hypothetical protein [Halobacterium sp. R2-5]
MAMSEATADEEVGVDEMVGVYRHDVHKFRGRQHGSGVGEFAGVRVNERVPLGADADASMLSRPRGNPEQSVDNHATPHRLSLVSGDRAVDDPRLVANRRGDIEWLVTPSEPEVLHARWLTSTVAGAYNETVYYPYTSLQYHVLLAGALLDNYREGYDLEDLYLVATEPGEFERWPGAAQDSDVVEAFRTVLWTPAFALHVTGAPGGRPGVRLGERAVRSFGDVWARLPVYPFDVGSGRRWRVLDAQLRRIRAWSTALAYIRDFTAAYKPHEPSGDARRPSRGEGP